MRADGVERSGIVFDHRTLVWKLSKKNDGWFTGQVIRWLVGWLVGWWFNLILGGYLNE